jgi:hypothetical protein
MSANIIEETRKNTHVFNQTLDTLLWVAQTRSIDPQRAILSAVHIEPDPICATKTLMVATDGRRLHFARVDKVLESGDYKIWKSSPMAFFAASHDFGQQYPKFQSVIPKLGKDDKLKKIELVPGKPDYGVRLFKIAFQFHALKKAFFNLNYLRQATDGMSNGCFAFQSSDIDPVLIQDSESDWTRLAVVMPVRVQ